MAKRAKKPPTKAAKRPLGRPRRKGGQRRNKTIRFDEGELAAIDRAAELEAGRIGRNGDEATPAAWCRRVLLAGVAKEHKRAGEPVPNFID